MKRSVMKHNFRNASASAVQNKRVQAAVRKTAGVLVSMRNKTVSSKPQFEDLRSWGSRKKHEVSATLETWAAKFAVKVEEQGGVVHRAKDATEAGRIIADIARARGITCAVKSKSMTSEEIGLNEVLQAAGVEITETDLGEFIIQLAGEHPSHILAPAIHRNQQQVRELFREKLGAPDNLDVEGMVRFARKVLRNRFLEAGMGITGCNFAVADTGTVAIVTNEGNGRMCTTLPPVHVAIVGMEKIIPSIADLPDFLSLLTCSATGQRASSYISMTTGPRRNGETEGPEELHVVLLDNGRTEIAKGPWREILHCLHCGSCLNHCPVYNAVGGHAYESPYSGPMGTVLSSLIWGSDIYPDLANACTLCGRCAEVCAVKIPLPDYHRKLRNREQKRDMASYLAARLAANPGIYRRGLYALRKTLRNDSIKPLLPKLNKSAANWLSCRALPVPKEETSFRQWWQTSHKPATAQKLLRSEPVSSTTAPVTAATPQAEVDLFALYTQRAGALGVEIVELSTAELKDRLLSLLKEEQVSCTALPSRGWPQPLHQQLNEILAQSDCLVTGTEDDVRGTGWLMDELVTARLGVTFSPAYLAETGSLIYPAAPGKGTLASLLPEVHLGITTRDALYADLKGYFAANPQPMPSRLTQISGPSRTGDIEGTMTVGVHGPRRVIHWIISDMNKSNDSPR